MVLGFVLRVDRKDPILADEIRVIRSVPSTSYLQGSESGGGVPLKIRVASERAVLQQQIGGGGGWGVQEKQRLR